jgi:hypothetical protein
VAGELWAFSIMLLNYTDSNLAIRPYPAAKPVGFNLDAIE